MTDITFTAIFPFGGSGGGALGFASAEARLLSSRATFEILGSIDFDEVACADFESFTGAPAWCVDVEDITAEQLRERYGPVAPDVVFMSPPCKGSSRLLSSAKAKSPKYHAMNRLALVWTRRMLEAWKVPPALLLLENVPGLPSRAAGMIEELRELLAKNGYLIHEEDHDCGELGELAQHRRRYLLVARRPDLCTSLLYQPRKRKVRAVGEVLSLLPMPGTVAARRWGSLHDMPEITWRNWLRLALIPAGGDWRDLDGVLAGRKRREVFRRHAVQAWDKPHPAVTGPGGIAVENVADIRVGNAFAGGYGVTSWDSPSGTINPRKKPPFIPVIIAEDGSWHRPMTPREMSALQGYPLELDGKPIPWAGARTQACEHIGNSVPPPAAKAIAERMLFALLETSLGGWSLSGPDTPVWVEHLAMQAASPL